MSEERPIAITARDAHVPAEDGFRLEATLREPERRIGPDRPIVVIGSAAAVPRRYYGRFAEAACRRGARALTFDYRGVGGSRPASLRGFSARMRDWGAIDIPGVLAWTHRTFPSAPIHWLGHSYGGFGTGLAHNNTLVARQLSVATMSGYWRMLRGFERYRAAVLMGAVVPPLVRAFGYFPGRWTGAEDLPRDVFLEWARWVMTPDFLFGDLARSDELHFHRLTAPLRIIRLADDPWASEEAVRHLIDRFTGSPDRGVTIIDPKALGIGRVGHLGFFRVEHAHSLWQPALDWLLGPSA